jgi:uncharacterized membrane protein YukC
VATVQRMVEVRSREEMEQSIGHYVAEGFTVAHRSDTSIVLLKKKEFQVVWAVVGFFLCVFPLVAYLVYYATQKDEMVEIRVSGP